MIIVIILYYIKYNSIIIRNLIFYYKMYKIIKLLYLLNKLYIIIKIISSP